MPFDVARTGDPAVSLDALADLVAADPVGTNVVHGLLAAAATSGASVVVRLVRAEDGCVGALVGDGSSLPAVLTPMPVGAAAALGRAVGSEGDRPTLVQGPAAVAAAFAGELATAAGVPARPTAGERVYEAGEVVLPAAPPGRRRLATRDDVDVVVGCFEGFATDTGLTATQGRDRVRGMIEGGRLHVWDDDGVVGCVVAQDGSAGVRRVGFVYTADGHRGRGIAARLTAEVTEEILAGGDRAILYTQLENPVSNALYQRIGYVPVADHVRYRFDAAA